MSPLDLLTPVGEAPEPRTFRDMSLALEPMDNFSKTPGTPNETPPSFWAAWDVNDRPRRIDTIVIVGLWTDECILSTAYAGSSRGYDVVVVGDAVSTATANHERALTIANSTVAKVLSTSDVIRSMEA